MNQSPQDHASDAVCHPALADPWDAALAMGPGTVMAVLTATHGPAYRDAGTAMAIGADGRFAGALSSGCIEADLILHAAKIRETGTVLRLRYGEGSPFIDLRLPCGGAIEVMLVPLRDFDALRQLAQARRARRPVGLHLSPSGRLSLHEALAANTETAFVLPFLPPLRFVIFGAGPEATVFTELVRSLNFDHVLVSHDDSSLTAAEAMGCTVRRLTALPDFTALVPDERCAALLFYHDHDYEPQILRGLLDRPAFYIGAQGSRATHAARLQRLADLGVAPAQQARVRGPIGLIPSSRDPRLLAISALAEVMQAAETAVAQPERT